MNASEPAGPITAGPISASEFAARMDRLGGFETRPRVAVGVSGGADSLGLVLLAQRWAAERGGDVLALIVDHGLRAESAAEAARVGGWLQARGVAHAILRWDGEKPASGIQEAARAARHHLLAERCRKEGVLHLALAHHRDDQAETVLLRFSRGSGIDGLAGMAPVRAAGAVRVIRPLLDLPHKRLVATCRAFGQEWIEDPVQPQPTLRPRPSARGGRGAGRRGVGRAASGRPRPPGRPGPQRPGDGNRRPAGRSRGGPSGGLAAAGSEASAGSAGGAWPARAGPLHRRDGGRRLPAEGRGGGAPVRRDRGGTLPGTHAGRLPHPAAEGAFGDRAGAGWGHRTAEPYPRRRGVVGSPIRRSAGGGGGWGGDRGNIGAGRVAKGAVRRPGFGPHRPARTGPRDVAGAVGRKRAGGSAASGLFAARIPPFGGRFARARGGVGRSSFSGCFGPCRHYLIWERARKPGRGGSASAYLSAQGSQKGF
ncbi:protein of unknown function [Azospirillum baldaniorum]|uniref:tRNA(Ile)-lysidine synthase n=1 Tax=Azospirillum baldaniorum TaxID=1064539 RepID=A0A9P1JQQ3_9PROT|nr:protein of unknown function [Azospirillum baldaniorum]